MRLFSVDLPILFASFVVTQPQSCGAPQQITAELAASAEQTVAPPTWGAALCVHPDRILLRDRADDPLRPGDPLMVTMHPGTAGVGSPLGQDLTVVEVRASKNYPDVCVFFSGPQMMLETLSHALRTAPGIEPTLTLVRPVAQDPNRDLLDRARLPPPIPLGCEG
ncbi:MAG: hypothetical protein AAFV53_13620 [Myxococcota bacterium]